MKISDIVEMNFKQLIRDKKNLFFLLLFPLIFMLIFGFAYSGFSFDDTINVAVLNEDNPSNDNYDFSADLVDILKEAELNESTKIFNITSVKTEQEAYELIQENSVSFAIIIPENFSDDTYKSLSGQSDSNDLSRIIVEGNPSTTSYGIGQSVLNSILSEYSSKLLKESTNQDIKTIDLESKNLEGTDLYTTFDYYAPGLIVFAILMTITSVTSSISRDAENGMLRRLKLSNMKTRDYVIANLISWSFMGAVQVIILLIVAVLMNFHWQGGLYTLLLACIVGIIASIVG